MVYLYMAGCFGWNRVGSKWERLRILPIPMFARMVEIGRSVLLCVTAYPMIFYTRRLVCEMEGEMREGGGRERGREGENE